MVIEVQQNYYFCLWFLIGLFFPKVIYASSFCIILWLFIWNIALPEHPLGARSGMVSGWCHIGGTRCDRPLPLWVRSGLWYVLRTAPVFSFLLTCFKGSIDKLASFGLKYMLDELFSRLSRSSLSDNSLSVDWRWRSYHSSLLCYGAILMATT